ncbi:MFS transporter [Paractinoplanes abujensis]|uniref:MFS family permease n=1 Tax=Paractinoplanes abujensis TaxID=882441 RepID=A0A7W7G1Q2_9ACTN|nr:MFS transporter [Actinoplanes abujensis]MBB4692395.1 MFS family permease [Actinoplanes abujensis]GID24128.1 MFS transporter [Actinoplanes abujensis]
MVARPVAESGPLAPLRYGPFRLLAAGRMISMLGNAVAPIALAFAVLDLTGSAGDLGLVVGARSLTNVVFLLLGGVIADRLPRHLVMVGSSVVAALTQAAVAATVLTGTATVPVLMVLSAVNGLAWALAWPAVSALLPQTVPEAIRKQANAINRIGGNTAMILGAPAGGILVATVGPGWGLAADAVSFALSGLCFALIRVPVLSVRKPSVLAGLRDGWSEFTSRTWLWVVVLGFMFLNAAWAAAIGVLGPVVADDTIGRRAWGFVLAAQTAGMIAGALLAIRLNVRRLLAFGVVAVGGQALLPAGLGLAPALWVLMVCAFAGGVAFDQFGIAWETTMQEYVPAGKLARVYSYDMLGSLVAIPIGQVVAGPAAHALGARTALLIAAGVIVLAVAGMLTSRDVRTLEHRPGRG